LRAPLSTIDAATTTQKSSADLRKFVLQVLERHIEKKLVTRGMVEKMGS